MIIVFKLVYMKPTEIWRYSFEIIEKEGFYRIILKLFLSFKK